MSFRVNVRGAKELAAKFARWRQGLNAELERSAKKAVLFVQENIPPYPPPPQGSKYQRTYTLGKSLTSFIGQHPDAIARTEVKGLGRVVGYVGSKVNYSPYVIDEDNQARVHAGRWYTLQGVVRKLRGNIRNIYAEGIRKFLGIGS